MVCIILWPHGKEHRKWSLEELCESTQQRSQSRGMSISISISTKTKLIFCRWKWSTWRLWTIKSSLSGRCPQLLFKAVSWRKPWHVVLRCLRLSRILLFFVRFTSTEMHTSESTLSSNWSRTSHTNPALLTFCQTCSFYYSESWIQDSLTAAFSHTCQKPLLALWLVSAIPLPMRNWRHTREKNIRVLKHSILTVLPQTRGEIHVLG